jgi:histidine decarboxylase
VYSAILNLEPRFDFEAGADSIAISGHKFIGSPVPCGLVLVKKNYKDRIGKLVPYIGTMDTTIAGSRNGHSPVFMWYAIKKLKTAGLRERALESLRVAEYAEKELKAIAVAAWRNPFALTVVFPEPAETVRVKWQIATENGQSHIICMPGITKEKIDEFIEDMRGGTLS